MNDALWSRRPSSPESAGRSFGRAGVRRRARLLTEVTRDGLRFQELVLHVEGSVDAPATVISNGSAAGQAWWFTVLFMIEVGAKKRNQPAPPTVVFQALTEPERAGGRPWLHLLEDEIRPQVIESDRPALVVWSSIWSKRSDAVIRFDLPPAGGGTDLRWTLSVQDPIPDEALLGHLRKRMNQLINGDLRYSFGQ